MLSLLLFSFDHQTKKNMKILKRLTVNNSLIARLLPLYTQTFYTIIRIFVTIYGF